MSVQIEKCNDVKESLLGSILDVFLSWLESFLWAYSLDDNFLVGRFMNLVSVCYGDGYWKLGALSDMMKKIV